MKTADEKLWFALETSDGPRAIECPDAATLRALERMAALANQSSEGESFYWTPRQVFQRRENGTTVPMLGELPVLRISSYCATQDARARLEQEFDLAHRYRTLDPVRMTTLNSEEIEVFVRSTDTRHGATLVYELQWLRSVGQELRRLAVKPEEFRPRMVSETHPRTGEESLLINLLRI